MYAVDAELSKATDRARAGVVKAEADAPHVVGPSAPEETAPAAEEATSHPSRPTPPVGEPGRVKAAKEKASGPVGAPGPCLAVHRPRGESLAQAALRQEPEEGH